MKVIALHQAAQGADLLAIFFQQLLGIQVTQAQMAFDGHFVLNALHDAVHVLLGEVQALGFGIEGVAISVRDLTSGQDVAKFVFEGFAVDAQLKK